ncbi:MATE family efflux transporter [Acetobacter fallax]|uniref:Multidrug transporter n=1 Tax=Acetobacter fallax TaxID=1737473 RepID=A0ABX0KIA0_9PROT|nr:MATE family efflux transporter [Acetobacter fallax]NHO33632.1 multidrug transporter [Acetobacter fallax]NHO37220.1 multidrug transporter [Acetobacter fallax]
MSGKPAPGRGACFVTGSIMRHVLIMAGTGAIGLMAVFAVDMLNMIYIAHLGDPALTAAIGFAGAVGGIQIAVSIGLTIGLGASVGREIGCGRFEDARRIASSFLFTTLILSLVLGCATAILADPILRLLGASGDALTEAETYLHVVSPFLPAVALGMACSALMRAVGDAKRSMNVTLAGAVLAAFLDPVLILGLHEGLSGAAISSVLSRVAVLVLGLRGAWSHGILGWPQPGSVLRDTRHVGTIAVPAIMTNLATPIGSAYVTERMARFGLDAVGGQASVDRIVVVAFSFVFALTGAVGPIISQNLGAEKLERVREVLVSSLKLVGLCVVITWILLALNQNLLVAGFHAQGDGAMLIHLFCSWTVAGYLFIGMLFVANTAFNNLGHPLYSTLFNWGRATLGTIPFVAWGTRFGAQGVQIGQVLGSVVFGAAAIVVAFRVVKQLAVGEPGAVAEPPFFAPAANIATVSAEAAMAELDEIEDAELSSRT